MEFFEKLLQLYCEELGIMCMLNSQIDENLVSKYYIPTLDEFREIKRIYSFTENKLYIDCKFESFEDFYKRL